MAKEEVSSTYALMTFPSSSSSSRRLSGLSPDRIFPAGGLLTCVRFCHPSSGRVPSQSEWEELFSDGRVGWGDDKGGGGAGVRRRYLGS